MLQKNGKQIVNNEGFATFFQSLVNVGSQTAGIWMRILTVTVIVSIFTASL